MDAAINKGCREFQHWMQWMQNGCRKNAILHPEMQRMQMVGCRDDTSKLQRMQGMRTACIVDAPQTASFSFHPAVSAGEFRHWMQGMPEGCILHPQL